LIRPLKDPKVALAGTTGRYLLADIGAGPGIGVFVQGGLMAVRVEALRKHPMSERFPHAHSDKWISWELLRNGYKIANVRNVKSVWQTPMPAEHAFKYIHAEE
jgi:hypothetical protein